MTIVENFGGLTGHAIGTIIKSAMQRAIEHIRAKQFRHDIESKDGCGGKKEDFVTDADKGAQRVYVKLFRESFPLFGIVAEEDELSVPCTHPTQDIWLTVDPLDGTKAFIREQSHGIGTMVSLVADGEIIAAYVGDVMTGEIYGFRPGSEKVHRITPSGAKRLVIDTERSLADQFIQLRDEPWKYSRIVASLAGDPSAQATAVLNYRTSLNFFKGMQVDGGSIGIGLARLWKGEVGAAVLRPGHNTPWDLNPILGISQKLGFCFMQILNDGWVITNMRPRKEIDYTDSETVVVHESRIPELDIWLANFRNTQEK